jgi:DNA-binding CsgD family transcriptional regulator
MAAVKKNMRDLSKKYYSDRIGEIYGQLSGGAFNCRCLDAIATGLSSPRAAMVRNSNSNERDRIFAYVGYGESLLHEMMADARSSGLRFLDANEFPVGKAFTLKDIPGEKVENPIDLRDRFLYSGDERHTLIGMVESDASHQSLVWFSREVEAGNYSQSEVDELEMLLPHLRQAVRIADELTDTYTQLDTARQIFDRTPLGLFFVSPDGVLLYGNKTGREFIAAEDGFMIRDGRLSLRVEQQRKKFDGFLEKLKCREKFELMERERISVTRASGKSPYPTLVIPMRLQPVSGRLHDGRVILLQVHNPASIAERIVEDLEFFYDLTSAEAAVCERLCRSKRLSGVADELGVSLNTAKTHLIRSFRKIGVSSQAELLQRLAVHPKRE